MLAQSKAGTSQRGADQAIGKCKARPDDGLRRNPSSISMVMP